MAEVTAGCVDAFGVLYELDLERVPDPGGDRVRITLDGKFLPFQWG